MAEADRNIHVTLTADVEGYIAGMNQARAATNRLARAGRASRAWRISLIVLNAGVLGWLLHAVALR